jgi:hypothetical protein
MAIRDANPQDLNGEPIDALNQTKVDFLTVHKLERIHRTPGSTSLSSFRCFEFSCDIVIQTNFSLAFKSIFKIGFLKIKIFQRHVGFVLSIIEVV